MRDIQFSVSKIVLILMLFFQISVFASVNENQQIGEEQFYSEQTTSTGTMWQGVEVPDYMQLDYHLWDDFLKKHVYQDEKTAINFIDFENISLVDEKELRYFIHKMQEVKIHHYSPKEQQAYWINLYNAITVTLFLDYPHLKNMLDIKISKNYRRHGPWGAKLFKVHNTLMSLNDIESKLVHSKRFDLNMLYLLYFGAKGSPNLQPKAITPENIGTLMAAAPKEFITRPKMIYFQHNANLFVSSFYLWHKEQFNNTDVGIITHLRRYATPKVQKRLARYNGPVWYHYDWHLNESGSERVRHNYLTAHDQNELQRSRALRADFKAKHENKYNNKFDKCMFHT